MSSALETLRRDFGGGIIEPGGAEYGSASRTLLASGSPAQVLRPQSVGDVQAGVRFAASAGLVLSVRGGGHGFAGFGTNDGGVVIDLSQLANVEIIDSGRHLVRIGGGATWGQLFNSFTGCPATALETGRCRPRPRPAPRYWPGPSPTPPR
jgi:UDP-N-acetylenolpyruvoylglucosamine reductase